MGKWYIEQRVVEHAILLTEKGMTTREIARKTGWGKTTVHIDVSERIHEFSPSLASGCREVLEHHKVTRSMKGGLSTAAKYTGRCRNKRKNAKVENV